ncbi:MAG: hypothetical protein IJ815_00750 [Lachnospiraceae bacterium]|nr:hypothetical protein [Lachnospiraceae bacterium]
MARKMGNYKCLLCKQPIKADEEPVPYNGHFAHADCFNEMIRAESEGKRVEQTKKSLERKGARKAKDKKEYKIVTVKPTTKNKSAEEIADEKLFVGYIKELTGNNPDVKTYALAKKYTTEYGLKYEDLVTALKYFYEIKGNKYDPERFSVGIVPYVVEEARNYFAHLDETIKVNQSIDSSSFYKTQIVNIKQGRKRGRDMIDIKDINEG